MKLRKDNQIRVNAILKAIESKYIAIENYSDKQAQSVASRMENKARELDPSFKMIVKGAQLEITTGY